MRRTARVAIVTPSAVAAEGVAAILRHNPEFAITAVVATSQTDLATAFATVEGSVAVAIVDPLTPGLDLAAVPAAKTVALCTGAIPAAALKAYDASIGIYDATANIVDTIKQLALQPDEDDDRTARRELTQREREIIVAVVSGLSNKEIAAQMSVSVNTIMTHRRNIAAKLHIHSPAALTIYAIASKLVDISQVRK